MVGDLLGRLERAAHAFRAVPPLPPLPTSSHAAVGDMILPLLGEADHDVIQEQALGLLDQNLRGFLIVTVREFGHGADVEAQWRMPPCVWPVVGACLVDPLTGP